MAAIAHLGALPAVSRGSARDDRLASLLSFVEVPEGAPWRIELADGAIEITESRSHGSALTENDRETLIDAGSALFAVRLAMRCDGIRPRVEYRRSWSHSGPLARITASGTTSPSPDDQMLFAGGSLGCHPPTIVSERQWAEAEKYLEGAREEGARLHFLPAAAIKDIEGQCADRRQPFLRREPDDRAATVAVVCTSQDDLIAWLIAGQAVRRLQLVAESFGSTLTLFNAPLASPGFRARIIRETRFCDIPQSILCGCPTAR